ncbi:MAG: 16S rRNA (guanine(966)-N(2))-methyltransferase RsmD [Rickettsiales bacterium]
MRIIGGELKGKKIITNLDMPYRPTKSIAREMIFNVLSNLQENRKSLINGANVLDLFCGSGILGIESLSQGAANVTFIDSSKHVIHLLRQNLMNLEILDKSTLKIAELKNFYNFEQVFDIVFIDPPYNFLFLDHVFRHLIEQNCLKKESTILLEVESSKRINIPDCFILTKERIFGKSKFLFISVE